MGWQVQAGGDGLDQAPRGGEGVQCLAAVRGGGGAGQSVRGLQRAEMQVWSASTGRRGFPEEQPLRPG